ncbi:MAG: aldehyde dehydrogenase family protein, partial [Fimbriimonadaceae bacterium]|nr:aldehyde dehydrogenase family protein [Alphaproteobacteria bacterium]
MSIYSIVSPVDGSVYSEVSKCSDIEIDAAINLARGAQAAWAKNSLAERVAVCRAFIESIAGLSERIAEELTWQMGRPIAYTPKEVDRVIERTEKMIELAEIGLQPINRSNSDVNRQISRVPHGLVLVIAPWNYPYLTAINTIIPALLSGNAVILKPAGQTALTGRRLADAFENAGLPKGLFSSLFLTHKSVANLISKRLVDYVSFTGSVRGGKEIEMAAAGTFLPISLELGGKDPAYVMADAEIDFAAAELVDGSFFNSGQSCCGVERIYVDDRIFGKFVERFVEITRQSQKLGDPTNPYTTLGPVVSKNAADVIRQQINLAIAGGAKMLLGDKTSTAGDAYMNATVLTDVTHKMEIMTEETFGPVVGIMPVSGDEEAVKLMNDSRYGLSASFWTSNRKRAEGIAPLLNTGT